MATQDEFGRAIFNIEVTSEAEYRSELQKLENVTTRSVGKMTTDFSRLNNSTANVGSSSAFAARGVTTLGAAAALTGSKSLGLATQVGGLGIAFSELRDESLGAVAQIKAMGGSIGRFLISPVGLAIGALVALGGAIALIFDIGSIRTRLANWSTGLDAANQRLKEQEDRLRDVRKRQREINDALRDQIDIESGRTTRIALIGNTEQQNLEIELQQVKTLKARADAAAQAERATKARVLELKRELLIAQGGADAITFIADATERALAREIQRARAAKETADAKRREQAAWEAIVKARGPSTAGEALAQIQQARELVEATIRGNRILRETFVTFATTENLPFKQIARLSKELGIFRPAEVTRRQREAGAIKLSAFAQSGAGRVSFNRLDPAEADRKRKEDARTKDAKRTADILERIEPRLVGSGGAR